MSGFQRVKKANRQRSEPTLTVKASGSSYINKSAHEEWFGEAEQTAIYFDPEGKQIAFDPSVSDEESYSLTRQDETPGVNVLLSGALNALGIDREAMEDGAKVPLRENDEGLILADLSEFPTRDYVNGDGS